MHGVDPATRQVGESRQVLRPGQHLGLETAHGARRSRAVLDRPPADKLTHHWIAAQPVGVVDVLVTGEAREDRLAQETGKTMPTVPAGAGIGDEPRRHVQQAEGIVEFPVQQQAAVGTDRRALERELDRDVELQTQRAGFRFTRHVPGQILAPSSLTHCHGKDIMHLDRSEAASIGGMRV